MSIRQQMLDHAYHLLRQGQRPTADALLAACGGSKATAVQALAEFWTTYLPPRLASEASSGDGGPPGTVLALAREVWQRALTFADQELQAKTKAALDEAEAIKEQLTAEREALDREHEEMAEATRAAERRADEAIAELTSLRAHHAEVMAMNATLLRDREEAQRALAERQAEVERLTAALASLTAERQTLIEQHKAAIDALRQQYESRLDAQSRDAAEKVKELRDIWHEVETRLRVELDATRTELTKARQETQRVRDGWEGRLEAERSRAAKELAERLAEAKASADAQIAMLRDLIVRLTPAASEAPPHAATS
jgi:chromosome segregation ATPase